MTDIEANARPPHGTEASVRLRVEDLAVHFGGRPILKGINLDLRAGQVHVFVGRSGSGKTTLLRAINRLNELFSGCRTDGRIRIDLPSEAIDAYGPACPVTRLRRKVGMVFQNPNVLPGSVRANFRIPLEEVMLLGPREADRRLEAALKRVWLWEEVADRLDESASTLSGGQQQRLCLARALAMEPVVLLLDEPTASLDHVATRKIEALVEDLKRDYLVLVVSHNLAQARRIGDSVLVLKDGRIGRRFQQEELRSSSALEAIEGEFFEPYPPDGPGPDRPSS